MTQPTQPPGSPASQFIPTPLQPPPIVLLLPAAGALLGYLLDDSSGLLIGGALGWVAGARAYASHFPDGTFDPVDFQNALVGKYTNYASDYPNQ